MLIIIKQNTASADIEQLEKLLKMIRIDYTIWGDQGSLYYGLTRIPEPEQLAKIKKLPYVIRVLAESAREPQPRSFQEVKIKERVISRKNFTIIAGPCTIDNRADLEQTATGLKSLGINFLRGGAYKLRSSPHSYQGLGKEALIYMQEICRQLGMISVSEITSIDDLEVMGEYIDLLIVGTRNMQNFRLLSAIGERGHPVILKRGMSSTVREWILAAEYISRSGNEKIILCERGIRTFENYTRNTLDISAVPVIKKLTPYPVLVDPSHSSGLRDLVKPLSWAAAAVGADGLLIESHLTPEKALCDAQQTISIAELQQILDKLPQIIRLWDKSDLN